MDALIKAVFILLGWLLGLLSPRIIDLLQRPYRRDELRRSLSIELEGLKVSLAALLYLVTTSNRSIDRSLLQVIEPIMRSDKVFPEVKGIADKVSAMLKLSDEEITSRLSSKNPGEFLSLKKNYTTFPYIADFIAIPFLIRVSAHSAKNLLSISDNK